MHRLLGVVALAATLLLAPATQAAAAGFCQSGEAPRFNFGFAVLKGDLGDVMGDALECEHTNGTNGDTLQATTNGGLAFYRKATNTPTFTDGTTHWALTDHGLVSWTGTSIDPPGTVATASSPAVPAGQSPPPPAPPTAVPVPSTADIASRVSPSVVQVITDSGEGSGVRVAEGILTNAHVVTGARSITVATSAQRSAAATITRFDQNADLALLQTNLEIPSLNMESMSQQRQGDEVLILGYPLGLRVGEGGQASVSRGLISGTGIESGSGRSLIQTDAAVNPGNSGGAMVNMRGSLIGLPTFGVRGAQGVNFAVATDTIQAFLGQSLNAGTTAAPSVPATPPPPDPVYQTHNGPKTASQLRADLVAVGYGGPWDVNSMLAAYERANPCAGVADAYRVLQSSVQDAAKASARNDYQALKSIAAYLRARTYPQVLLPTVNAFLRMLDWQAPAAEIRFNWPLLAVVASRTFGGDLVLAAAQADLNRDEGEVRAAEIDFESALRQFAATCGA